VAKVSGTDQNAVRRAAKARQQALAKAKAAGKGTAPEPFSLAEATKEARRRENGLAWAIKRRTELADRLMATLTAAGAVTAEYDGETYKSRWIEDLLQFVRAVKTDKQYAYNSDWKETGRLVVGRRH
jgi:hypothetical protein